MMIPRQNLLNKADNGPKVSSIIQCGPQHLSKIVKLLSVCRTKSTGQSGVSELQRYISAFYVLQDFDVRSVCMPAKRVPG